MSVKRVYAEKKQDFAVAAKDLQAEIKSYLGIKSVEGVRVLIRYDVENVSDDVFKAAVSGVFAEPPVDEVYLEELPKSAEETVFSVEFLPGQYDQRADSAVQCVQFIKESEQPVIKTATTYVLKGNLSDSELEAIKSHCINPVDSREAQEEKPETLDTVFNEPADVIIFDGFSKMPEVELKELYDSLGLAMTFKDFLHIQKYFAQEEKRDPSMTEIRVLDTYWSDHCRHTTFSTELTEITFGEGDYNEPMEATYQEYLKDHSEIFAGREDKFVCLMDLALMAMRKLKKEGKLEDQEESDEINACSIVVPVTVDGKEEEWLVNFKNETHNHPTEIEPFGGAATCLGGAIRDPLSGRTYVYQAMRVTGAADPTVSVKETLPGKLPQKKIVREAAHGYSSYGNQIGLATGLVKEIYHPDYVAKRMEIGAVMGAAPRRAVRRLTSDPGDIIVLLGGRTGRDGIGGATGSSKVHTEESTKESGAEVQKGNPPTERKIQRLFRREEVSFLIKKCNDFGAGGVSVAIGELADGLEIDLDKVPKKYAGLDGTEIAISESQERMAVVVDPQDVDEFMGYAAQENLEAVVVAVVTETPRLVLNWRGKDIVNLSRAFLDTNGAHQETTAHVLVPNKEESIFKAEEVTDVKEKWLSVLADLNVCSQKGLVEMFDGSIGASSVFMPHGGKYQRTETQAMVAKLPVLDGDCDVVTMMSYGYDPYLSAWSPFHGAVYAVLESVSKIVACGGDYKKIRFTFQEYFKRMKDDPKRWGTPVASLLGAYNAQMGLCLPSIGGKDSMSGTFEEIDVPPTLVSFAVDTGVEKEIVSPELKAAGNKLVWVSVPKDGYDLPKYDELMALYDQVLADMRAGKVVAAYTLDRHGVAAGLAKMAFGNELGVKLDEAVSEKELFAPAFGDLVLEVASGSEGAYQVIGEVTAEKAFTYKEVSISLEEALASWEGTLEKVFPSIVKEASKDSVPSDLYEAKDIYICQHKVAKPQVFIPVMPGTNCEYDTAKAFKRAGATTETIVFKNLSGADITESLDAFARAIDNSQIVMFPGGFSAGDEPDGSAKFFATACKHEKLKASVSRLLNERDGLILGICNGFQALIKLGLLPNGEITGQDASSPTLTYNTIGRHISKMVYTKVVSNKSPWLQEATLGNVYTNPASHGEGRFVATTEWLDKLAANGQIATQYCDLEGRVTMDSEWNVNGSYRAIEGITSPDGRILGKMAHSERRDRSVAINIYGEQDLKIFESGVKYFK
ncbi:phosphoribosylformylglycinamidine synthase [Ohessyouella blattaphilus]|uniref:Phosphoribosylformylglycinamidine synthase n=1 Tax=Ohessyouella blattaphilus TaxID=2949333 RepID=A0ABT1EHC1_9FIRM|nr:phosphoribosylformylglycinamidine synthase [Ohessyouella blattaphilus]MCP1110094.1 phosphoribosylformylglycinamidine synthase [Ohessyouella blattaphilus]MCR8563488.1 phosphoribosylformylglycinamidine synthase [Ohessyouella blattaphilus]